MLKKVPEDWNHEYENPFLISGTSIMEGTGYMMVLAVGRNSFDGKIKLKIQKDADDTPLQ